MMRRLVIESAMLAKLSTFLDTPGGRHIVQTIVSGGVSLAIGIATVWLALAYDAPVPRATVCPATAPAVP